jgi:hypothetical protein
VTTMVVGHVILQVVSAVFPPEKDPEVVRIPLYVEDWEQVLAKIWPSSRVFTSPPPQSRRLSLARVADRWKGVARSPDEQARRLKRSHRSTPVPPSKADRAF